MGVLSDRQIREGVTIEPFEEGVKREGVISYGLSSYGYDIRIADKFKVFTPTKCTTIDPKAFDEKAFVEVKAGEAPNNFILIPPNSFVLGHTVEYMKIPRDTITICVGKSTYARCGILINVTPFEPEWEGNATIEISNTTPLPAKIYANEGIAQILFLRSDEMNIPITHMVYQIFEGLKDIQDDLSMTVERYGTDCNNKLWCQTSYADKKGKYQGQKGKVVLPKVDAKTKTKKGKKDARPIA